ncbi:MAG: hypothetical protein L3J54_12585 [Draconibacterium sp.]|nr:hypothetical protein [Draconibacterium sp.]
MKRIIISLVLVCIVFKVVHAQNTISAIRVDNPPVIDGRVDEAVWDEAFMVNEFYQREPNEGAPISEKTEFYICYDSNNIYFGIKCWDDPKKITAKEANKDPAATGITCGLVILRVASISRASRQCPFFRKSEFAGEGGQGITASRGHFANSNEHHQGRRFPTENVSRIVISIRCLRQRTKPPDRRLLDGGIRWAGC